jgi:deoxyribodipyrimidine photolyase-related protein
MIPVPVSFPPDAITREVLADVERHFPDHPGSIDHFDWPITPEQATEALEDFVAHRLPAFGPFQDALWTGGTYLYHSRLSAAMNLGLISPRCVIDAAVGAYQRGTAPLASVEGFVRQILGWRELVRGLYWDFLMRHEDRFGNHPRAGMQWRNLARLDAEKRAAIQSHADTIKRRLESSAT